MDANRYQRLKSLLVGALARPPAARPAYLRRHGRDDEGLVREALELLAYDIDEEDPSIAAHSRPER